MKTLFHPVTFLFAIMSIQWVTIASLGPFSVKLPYLALSALAACAAISPRVLESCIVFAWRNAIWLVPYLVYLLILAPALHGSPAANIAPRQMLYVVCGVALGGYLAADPRVGSVLRLGAGLGILLFIAVVEVMARSVDLSWTTAISHFLSTGDLNYMVYTFFRGVFNSLAPEGEVEVGAAAKNGLAVCIFIAGLLFRAGHSGRSLDWPGFATMGLVLFMMLLLNTRSVLIVAGAGLVGAAMLGAAIRRDVGSPAILVVKLIGGLAALVLVAMVMSSESAVLGTMQDRFAFDDESAGARVEQVGWALEQIEGAIFTGSGYAEVSGHVIHNLFLSSWVHAGLPAFLLTLGFYLAILALWLGTIWRVIRDPGRWVLPVRFEWLAVLPILPLFRVWLSGDAGHLFLGEWIALTVFFGIVLGNDRAVVGASAAGQEAGGEPGEADGDEHGCGNGRRIRPVSKEWG